MINRELGIPYYRQIMERVRQQINAGFLKEGDQVPGELKMSEIYQVNFRTVRQAIGELCNSGVLYKLKGKGTFVAQKPLDVIEYRLSIKNRFSENIAEAGQIPNSKILRAAEMVASGIVGELLSLRPGERVYLLDVLRQVNGQPLLTSRIFLPAQHFPGLLESIPNFRSLSLIFQRYGISPRRVKSSLRASFPSQEEALVLGIPRSMPVIKAENLLVSQEGVPIEYLFSCYRGDIAKLSISW
jgi:phosphonate metabolism transcriptional regulator PhnF